MPGTVCVRLHLKFPRIEEGDPQNGLYFLVIQLVYSKTPSSLKTVMMPEKISGPNFRKRMGWDRGHKRLRTTAFGHISFKFDQKLSNIICLQNSPYHFKNKIQIAIL